MVIPMKYGNAGNSTVKNASSANPMTIAEQVSYSVYKPIYEELQIYKKKTPEKDAGK